MEHKIINLPAHHIIGLTTQVTHGNSQSKIDMAKLWEDFLSKEITRQIPNKVSHNIIALYTDHDKEQQTFNYILGNQVKFVDTVPDGLIRKTIPAGNYVTFTASGQMPQALLDTWDKIKDANLNRAFTNDFEVYNLEKFTGNEAEIVIYIAIKKPTPN